MNLPLEFFDKSLFIIFLTLLSYKNLGKLSYFENIYLNISYGSSNKLP